MLLHSELVEGSGDVQKQSHAESIAVVKGLSDYLREYQTRKGHNYAPDEVVQRPFESELTPAFQTGLGNPGRPLESVLAHNNCLDNPTGLV